MSTGFSFGSNTNTPGFGQSAFGAQPTGSITFGTPVSSVGNTSFGQPTGTGFGSTNFSSGFGFGNTPASTATTSYGFGNMPASTASTGFGFGSTPASTVATGFGFGSNPSTSAPGFGFGTPQNPQQSTSFGLGGQMATPTGFGFGAPTSSSAGTGFGMASTSTPGAGFGLTQTAPVGAGFGSTPVASSAATGFGFGMTPASSAVGLSFGATATPQANAGFGFGTVSSAPAGFSSSLNFGAPAPSAGLSFGAPATTNTTFSLGGTLSTPASTGLSFGAPATSTGLSFGATPASTGFTLPQPQTTSMLGTSGGGLTIAASTSAPTFNFNASTTTAPAILSFPTSVGTSTAASTGFSLGGTLLQTPSFGLGGTTTTLSLTTTTASTPSVGLGGIAQSTPKTGTTAGKTEILPRDQPLPNEIIQTVDSFKNFVKQQKGYSSDVARCSVKEFKKVASDIDTVSNLLKEVEKQVQANRATAEKLKHDTAKGLQNVEMAQRTFDTPPGLQYENTAPSEFFAGLVDGFEREMHNLKMQIENTDKYVRNMGKPSSLSSQDLALGMRRLHETFVALAGRLQQVHSQVESQKEQYLNLRRYMLRDDTNVFETAKPRDEDAVSFSFINVNYKPPSVASGPTPFNSLMHPSVVQAAFQNQTQQTIGLGPQNQSTNLFGAPNTNLFGNTSIGASLTPFGQLQQQQQQNTSLFGASSSFQLQKPPIGNKRAK